jgi:hypothetical protein
MGVQNNKFNKEALLSNGEEKFETAIILDQVRESFFLLLLMMTRELGPEPE